MLWIGFPSLGAIPIPDKPVSQEESGWYYRLQPQFNFTHASQNDQIPRWGYANLDQVQVGYQTSEWVLHSKIALALTSDVLTNRMAIPSSVWFDVKNLYLTWSPQFLVTPEWKAGVTVGRFRISDFTQEILDHDFDGISLYWKSPGGETRLETGFSGLLGKKNSLLEDSTLDFLERQPSLVISPSDWTDYNDSSRIWDMPRQVIASWTKMSLNSEITCSIGLIYLLDLRSWLAPGSEVSSGTTTYDPAHGGDVNSFYSQALLQFEGDFPGWIDLVYQKGRLLMYRVNDSSYKPTDLTAYSLGGAWGPSFFEKKLRIQGFFRMNSGDADSRIYPLQAFVTKSDQNSSYFPLVTDNAVLGAPFYGGGIGMAGAQILWDNLREKAFPHKFSFVYKSLFKTNTGPLMVQGYSGVDRSTYLGWSTEFFAAIRPVPQAELQLGWSLIFPETGTGSYWEGIPVSWVSRTAVSVKMDF